VSEFAPDLKHTDGQQTLPQEITRPAGIGQKDLHGTGDLESNDKIHKIIYFKIFTKSVI